MKYSVLIMSTMLAISCSQDNKRLKDKINLESTEQLKVENKGLSAKAEAMEKDLTRRHLFYQSVKGMYEGSISTSDGTFSIRITLTPSLAPLKVSRSRQLEEIASDLNNLTLNTQIVQWDPKNTDATVACPGVAVKPDIENGVITIPSSEICKNLYKIKITERGFRGTTLENSMAATRLAQQILNGDLSDVDSLNGTIQPSTNASIFKFVANKVQE